MPVIVIATAVAILWGYRVWCTHHSLHLLGILALHWAVNMWFWWYMQGVSVPMIPLMVMTSSLLGTCYGLVEYCWPTKENT